MLDCSSALQDNKRNECHLTNPTESPIFLFHLVLWVQKKFEFESFKM